MTLLFTQPGSQTIRQSLTLMALSLGFGVVQLDVTIVNTALSTIGTALGGGIAESQWVVSAYTTAFAALILSGGALGDRLGAKTVFMSGFAIFTLASLACALAPTSAVLIAARTAQGLGAALLVPNSLALLNHAYPDDKERGRAVGIWAAGASLALTAGPLVGGFLIGGMGWRSIFLVNIPIGLGALWLTWRCAAEAPSSAQREVDVSGQLAAIASLGLLAAALITSGSKGWTHPLVLAGLTAAAVSAALFVVCEQRSPQPMLPLALFRHPTFASTALIGFLVNVAFYGLIFVFSLYFQEINKMSPLATGLAFVPMVGVVLPVNLLASRMAEKIGPSATIAIGSAVAATGCVCLLGIHAGASYLNLCGQLVMLGVGLGLLVPPLTSLLLGSVDKSRSGIAAGVLNSTRQTGSVVGVALFGSLIRGSEGFVAGAHLDLIISAVILGAATLMSLILGLRSASQQNKTH